ncbi:MAG TPA: acyl-CoA desaturase [Candidatus Dormibacteraeota bacterium]
MNAIPADVGSVHAEADYAELRREVLAAGLLDRAYGYYLFRAGSCFAMLTAAIVIALVSSPTPAWLIVSAALLGFCIVQVALIGHDAGHREVFRSPARNDLLGLACWSLVAGVAFWYWNDRHNAHHGHTNDPENDPDIQGGGLLAFTEEEARDRTGWRLLALRHQGLLIWLSAGLLALWFRLESIVYVLRELRGRRRATELALAGANSGVWALAVISLGWKGAALFLITQICGSVYLAALIAPNHKGMPVWARDAPVTFLQRQVLGSRNVNSHPLWDYLFGGLNYQIEHHLFPNMPRVNLRRCREIVRPFCAARGLEYTEVGPLASYRMIRSAYLELRDKFA